MEIHNWDRGSKIHFRLSMLGLRSASQVIIDVKPQLRIVLTVSCAYLNRNRAIPTWMWSFPMGIICGDAGLAMSILGLPFHALIKDDA